MEVVKNKSGSISFKEKVYLANGKTETKTFDRKTDARAWKANKKLEIARNKALGIQPLKENLLFSEIFELWMNLKIKNIKNPKTVADYQSAGRKHLLRYFGALKIRSMGVTEADELVARLKVLGLANKTTNKITTIFKQVVSFAESQGYIAKSPLRGLPSLPEKKGRMEFLTQEEAVQLLRANRDCDSYPFLVLALNTGMRVGEITGLCWDRVDFGKDIIEISRTLGRSGLKETTKTNLVRYIHMNKEVREVLLKLKETSPSETFVFTKRNGRPFNPDHYSKRHLRRSIERAGIRAVTCHTLRHTYASHWMMNGGQIYDLQNVLGHTRASMTSIYAHLSPQHLKKVMDTVRFSAEGNHSVSPFLAP